AQSVLVCPHCGTSQVPEIEEPWSCAVCGTINSSDDDVCIECNKPRGAPNPASSEALLDSSDKDDALSIPHCTVVLADGSASTAATNSRTVRNLLQRIYVASSTPCGTASSQY